MPETALSWPGVAEMARTAVKKESRDMQERSLRGTASVERGMATKRVVWDCLCGARREGDEEGGGGGGGLWWVDWGLRNVVGVDDLEGFWEKVEGVGGGEERVDWEWVAVER